MENVAQFEDVVSGAFVEDILISGSLPETEERSFSLKTALLEGHGNASPRSSGLKEEPNPSPVDLLIDKALCPSDEEHLLRSVNGVMLRN